LSCCPPQLFMKVGQIVKLDKHIGHLDPRSMEMIHRDIQDMPSHHTCIIENFF